MKNERFCQLLLAIWLPMIYKISFKISFWNLVQSHHLRLRNSASLKKIQLKFICKNNFFRVN